MKDTKGTQNFFLLKAKLHIIREILIASKRACKAKDHEKKKEARDKRAKQQKKQTVAKSKIPVNNKTCKHKKISTRGCTEPTRDQYRQNTEDTSRSFNWLLYKRKEPGEGSGAASTHHRETYFQFFDPPAFCTKKQKARGLHSVSAIFDKIALSTTTKEPGGRQDKKTFWLFVPNSKKLGGYTH